MIREGVARTPRIRSYTDLEAWRQAMELVEQCYRLTRGFPASEEFALKAQLRKAAVSIPSNIAEGHSRRTTQAYIHHVSITLGSQAEVETHVELARRLGFISDEETAQFGERARSVRRLLYGLVRALQRKAR